MLFSFFKRKPVPFDEFERRVFELVAKRVVDRKSVEECFRGIQNLAALPASEHENRQKFAAHWYFLLENHIAQEQPRARIPREILREQILNKCEPQRAEGNFALIFLSSHERQIKLFERFAEKVLEKIPGLIERTEYKELFLLLESDGQLQGIFKDGAFMWEKLAQKTRTFTPEERIVFTRDLLKRAFGILAQRISGMAGEMRTELMFKTAYQEFRDNLIFIEDVPKVLLLVPEGFLGEERIGLMEKTELEDELRRKKQALEVTLAELQGEKTKLSSLSREELEKRVEERTAELVNALEDVKAGRAKLEEAKAKDEAFLEHIGDGLVAIDAKKKILLWNKAASAISGWSGEEALGKSLLVCLKLVHERSRSTNMDFIDEVLFSGEGRKMQEDTVLVRKDGRDIAVLSSASPIFDEHGKVASVIIIFRDISNERELQKTREEFASLATHELRTPVAAIKGYVELLLDGTVGDLREKQKEYLAQIKHLDKTLLTLVNAMLNVSRIELGTLAIDPEPVYLPQVAEDVLSELAPKIEEKKLEVKSNYEKNFPTIDLDPGLMHAVFQNLFSNAVKYTPDKGKVTLTIQKQESDVLVSIADTGFGIPEKQQSKVFDKLFRADNAREKVIEGTGLGLYMVKSILDQSGGKIWFESEENKGTTFFVTIPLAGMKKREGIKGLS